MAYINQDYNDGMIQNGDFITNPCYQKTSMAFKCDEMLNDSDCSEDYDEDMFFEGS